ncbi:MAG: class I SAM-dependent methyltransferase [Candidatus Fermentibacteraceae bacterium]|nr:class I SAM-dependent methyltransferase [Candidatus Fermentibacteraceae bacterium]MBN2609190.1 class I SAM-dependent methyltransferase [Candidatus Fermentibacteraceae bacterium]
MSRGTMDWTSLPREKTDCLVCGSVSNRLLSVQDGWPVVRCTDCGLVYLGERPAEQAVEEMYSRSYYEDGDVGYKGYIETFEKHRRIFMKIFRKRHRDLRRHSDGIRLLEVGCAYGLLLDYLRGRGWEVTGVEVSPLSSEYAREKLGLNVLTGTVETVDLPEGSFDVVLLLDVLEHLHRPYDTLGRIKRLMAPDGILVVQCPWELYHWEEAAEAILRGMRPGTIEPDAVPAHLYFFGPRTLEKVLTRAGFVITARQSGNYGAVRRKVRPPVIRTGNPVKTVLRCVYFRLGLQKLLYFLARLVHLGSGMIRYARPAGSPEE